MHKKCKHCLQQRFTHQHKSHFKPYECSHKLHFSLDHGLTVAAVFSTDEQLPLLTPSSSHVMNTDMLPDCCNLDWLLRATLTEVMFHLHFSHCCFFTAVIQDGCAEWEVSFSQVVWLIASISHVRKIDNFTIKPVEQHLFLLTGFSQHTSSRPSFNDTALLTAAKAGRDHIDATCTWPQRDRAVDAKALASRRSKPSISNDDGGLSNSNSESSSDDDGCLSEDKQDCLSTSKHSQWSDLDEQRLLAYKKEGKDWEWIFGKFPGRTRPAIRTRWNMVRPRASPPQMDSKQLDPFASREINWASSTGDMRGIGQFLKRWLLEYLCLRGVSGCRSCGHRTGERGGGRGRRGGGSLSTCYAQQSL